MKRKKEKMVRKTGSFVLTAMLLLSVFAVFPVPAAAAGEIVSIGSAADVASGSTIKIPISIANVNQITGLSATLVYSTSVVSGASITANNSVFTSSVTVGGTEGNWEIGLTNTEKASDYITTTEDTPIIDVTFNVVGTQGSSTTLDLQNVMLSDSSFNSFPPETVNDGTVTVEGEAPAPEVVINEFVSDNTTEWVELYNNGSSSVDLTGWALEDEVGNSKSLSGTIGVDGYIVFTCTSGWLNNGGDIIWLNSTTENVDRVGYGTSGGAPAPGASNSTGRYPNGVDTDDDAADFIEFGTPTPAAANEIPDTEDPIVTVTAPNGGETWIVGASQDITWTATDNVGVTAVDIAYSTDGGANYTDIATGEANDGTYMWTVPDDPSTTCRVKVVAYDLAGNDDEDESDANFTIALDEVAPVVTVTAPNGGESWTVGASQDITWTATDNVGVTAVVIAYSTDGGANYTDIATDEENDGTYTWTVPDDPSTTCRVKVVAQDAAGNDDEDVSNADFTIATPPTPTPTPPTPTPAPAARGGGGGGRPRDTDGDGYTDLQELVIGADLNDPCEPDPNSAACLAIRPPEPAPTPAATPAAPTPTVVTVPPPAATPAAPTPEATEEPGGILQAIPGFEAIFVVAGVLAVAFLLLRRKRK